MAEMSVFWLRVAAALYALGLIHAILTLVRRREQMFRAALAAMVLGAVFHFVSIVEEGRYQPLPHHQLLRGAVDVRVPDCAAVSVRRVALPGGKPERLCLPAGICDGDGGHVRESGGRLVEPGAEQRMAHSPHRAGAFWLRGAGADGGGLAAVFVSGAELKAKKPRKFYYKLPALGTLDEVISKSIAVGFTLITLAVITASAWAFIDQKTRWIRQPQIAISFFTWGAYLALVFLRNTAGWRGRKAALMTVVVLGFSALTWAAHVGWCAADKTMKLLITGVSHKTAPVEVRERFAFRETRFPPRWWI